MKYLIIDIQENIKDCLIISKVERPKQARDIIQTLQKMQPFRNYKIFVEYKRRCKK